MTARRPGVTRRLSSYTTRGQLSVSGPYAAPRAQTQAGSARPKPGGPVCQMTGGRGHQGDPAEEQPMRRARKRAVLEQNAQANQPSLPLIQYLGTVSHKAQPRSSPGLLDTRAQGSQPCSGTSQSPWRGIPAMRRQVPGGPRGVGVVALGQEEPR